MADSPVNPAAELADPLDPFHPLPSLQAANSLGAALLTRLASLPATPLCRVPAGEGFRPVDPVEQAREILATARAFAAFGLEKGDRVALMGPNGPFWANVDLAAQLLGLVVVPLYQGQQPAELRYILEDAGPSLVCLDGKTALDEVRAAYGDNGYMPAVAVRGAGEDGHGIRSWEDLLGGAEAVELAEVARRSGTVSRADLATLVYTSGTTGWPKGVELTHDNLLANLEGILKVLEIRADDRFLSFLPLAHIFERTAGHLLPYLSGAEVAYARSTQTVTTDLARTRPTVLLAVPRLYKLFHERVQSHLAGSAAGRRLARWINGSGRLRRATARVLLRRRIRDRLGGRIRLLVSGGAALPPEVGRFFRNVGVPILEGYGQTETAPVVTVNPPDALRVGTVGPPLPNVDVRIAEDSEILVRGPSIMRGYWNRPEETARTFDGDWLLTGDIGQWDAAGYLTITDRKKEILVTSGGKNIPPQRIELRLTAQPLIQQAVVLGDRQPYLGALIYPDWERIRAELGAEGTDPDSAAVTGLMRQTIHHALSDLPSWEQVRRFRLLAEPFTQEAGEVTPTLKIRRKVVAERHREAIAALFEEGGG